jgi:beta-lactamase class D OXA-29
VKFLCLIFCSFLFAVKSYAKDCFIVSENNRIIYCEGEYENRYTPASTFKIAISLMGFDSGILIDEMHPT